MRTDCENIEKLDDQIKRLIDDMFETMAAANGVGLAAPQIGKSLNLFCVDVTGWEDEEDMPLTDTVTKRVFINPEIVELSGEPVKFKEGCLSLPGINEDVEREQSVTIRFLDENFDEQTETFSGIMARAIQHEYDHIHGKLFADYLTPLRKSLLKSKLAKMSKGIHTAKYRCKNQ
ncbi:Peptide deformylase [Mucinivorans hirudinis]|uniref:Peptide deformylase n=1 Tax=Mucinivorans hirudinis TaxID=1433126 RepID=A0A060RCA5_9BACT|nr:Peptide deformylase [Mucinivorans hirudinis]